MRVEIIPFGDHEFLAVEENGEVRVAIRPCCDALGLAWNGQYERIMRHPLLSKAVRVIRTTSAHHDKEMVTLDLENFHGWLVTISSERITDPEKRAVVVEYQRRAFRVIYEHFHGPMTKQIGISVTEMIQLQRERRRIAKELIHETHGVERSCLYDDLLRTNARLGATTPSIEALGQSAVALADQAAPFFDLLAALTAAGVEWNHSRKPDTLWAVSMPEVTRLAAEAGIPFRLKEEVGFALRADPRFVAAKAVNSIRGGAVHCWVFEAPASETT